MASAAIIQSVIKLPPAVAFAGGVPFFAIAAPSAIIGAALGAALGILGVNSFNSRRKKRGEDQCEKRIEEYYDDAAPLLQLPARRGDLRVAMPPLGAPLGLLQQRQQQQQQLGPLYGLLSLLSGMVILLWIRTRAATRSVTQADNTHQI